VPCKLFKVILASRHQRLEACAAVLPNTGNPAEPSISSLLPSTPRRNWTRPALARTSARAPPHLGADAVTTIGSFYLSCLHHNRRLRPALRLTPRGTIKLPASFPGNSSLTTEYCRGEGKGTNPIGFGLSR
jgi:hypothetical protein